MLSIDDPDFLPYLREFERQSGIPAGKVLAMRPEDSRALLLGWATANRMAQLDKAIATEFPAAPPPVRYDPFTAARAIVFMALIAISAIIICSGIWRFFA